MIVQVTGTAGSGRSTLLGSHAIMHVKEGKKVVIFTQEHSKLNHPYFRNAEHLGATDEDISSIWVIGVTTDIEHSIMNKLEKLEHVPSIVMLDLFGSHIPKLALKVHEHMSNILSHHGVKPIIYNSTQANRDWGYPEYE